MAIVGSFDVIDEVVGNGIVAVVVVDGDVDTELVVGSIVVVVVSAAVVVVDVVVVAVVVGVVFVGVVSVCVVVVGCVVVVIVDVCPATKIPFHIIRCEPHCYYCGLGDVSFRSKQLTLILKEFL